jgi:hypothetical protein
VRERCQDPRGEHRRTPSVHQFEEGMQVHTGRDRQRLREVALETRLEQPAESPRPDVDRLVVAEAAVQ